MAIVCLMLGVAGSAHAKELISEFVVDIAIRQDGSFHVTEAITYDFGPNDRHGIFRKIPYRYSTAVGSYEAQLTNFEVTNEAGTPYIFEVGKQGDTIRVKIGDPDKTIRGQHTYVIQYDVIDALSNYTSFDELYWNVTGSEWVTEMRQVRGRVRFVGFEPAILDATCYRGPRGSNANCDADQTGVQAGAPVYEFIERDLGSKEGVTIALSFPKGFVEEPTRQEKLIKFAKENGVVGLPFVVLALMYWLWRTRGRDPAGRGAIVPQYDPPKAMTPVELGTIYDETVHPRDITAEIMYLAVHGYLRIHQIEKKGTIFTSTDYILEKLNDSDSLVNNFDRELMGELFAEKYVKTHEFDGVEVEGVALSDLKNELASEMSSIRDKVYEALVLKKYFPKRPDKIRTSYTLWGVLFVVIAVIGGFFFEMLSLIAALSIVASGIIIMVFAWIMPRRTKKGVLAKEHILGLKDYLQTAEKDRLEFHNDPERTPERFDALLPFAMVLSVEKEWAALFKEIYNETDDDGNAVGPSWYSVPPGHSFQPAMLAQDLGGFNSAMSTAATAPSSSGSSGGGSSGGGFGGGGGGSW